MPANGRPAELALSSKYGLKIEDFDLCWAEKIGGFASETEIAETYDGSRSDAVWVSPGRQKHKPLEIEVGFSENKDLYNWHMAAKNSATISGVAQDNFRKTLTVDVYTIGGKRIGAWVFRRAWPSMYEPGSFDATTTAHIKEKATIVHEGFDWEPAVTV